MIVKTYLKEWFYNAGIIGFLRILEHNEDEFASIKENYIEFDTEKLRNFSHYYFQYFFDRYNVANKTKNKINPVIDKIKNKIEKGQEDKKAQEQIKSEKKYLKLILKAQLDKIKKIDEESYQYILEQYNKIDSIKTEEQIKDLEEIQKIILEEIEKPNINKRLTLNLFKSVLSKNYFGQPSFLNVVKTGLSYEEQEKLMYRDYISNIVEMGTIQEIEEGKYSIEEVKEILKRKQQSNDLTKEITKIYKTIQEKYIEKEKTIEEIKQYLREKVFTNCCMCENEKTMTSNYSESNFVPLAVSSENMKNFFWNQNVNFPVCDICKLILFCIPAGITSISKTVKENTQGKITYKEKELYSFVNYDTDIQTLWKTNNFFGQNSKLDKNTHNPYGDLILNIVEQNKEISQWQLQNIFVIEFETEYLAFSRMEYFNIKRQVARFFYQYSGASLNKINDYYYKLEIIDNMLKDKDIKYIINERLREEIKKENTSGWNSFLATKTRLNLNFLKKEDSKVEERIKKNNDKIYVLYNLGVQIHEELKRKGEVNKINGYAYKMLNSIKAGNKVEFMDIVVRILVMMGKDVSPIFLEVMQETDLDFESIGHSFLAGLVSNKYEKKEEVKNNE